MSTPIFTRAIKCINLISLLIPITVAADWKVDLSRRQNSMSKPAQLSDIEGMPRKQNVDDSNMIEKLFEAAVPTQDIVIINTEQGFIPSTVRVKEGGQYRIVIVNVNEKARNVSFVLDSFSEHHATFYGKTKSFYIKPKKEGVYSFISPETSAQGRLVVYPGLGGGAGPAIRSNDSSTVGVEMRSPASE